MDLDKCFVCHQCRRVISGGLACYQEHLRRIDHVPPYVCGQNDCPHSYLQRRNLFEHIRSHHLQAEDVIVTPPSVAVCGSFCSDFLEPAAAGSDSDICAPENDFEVVPEEEEGAVIEHVSLERSAQLSVLKLRSVTYMTGAAIQTVEEEAFQLMQDTASHLKMKVMDFLSNPIQNEASDKDKANLLREFTIEDPFTKIRTKKNQMICFEQNFGLLAPRRINLPGYRCDSRQHPKRPRLEAVQVPKSFQYVSIISILKNVMSDSHLRNLILSEKASDDGFLRSFRDGSLYLTLPPDLKEAVRIILYIDDLEPLQALSARAGVYKLAGIYFGVQNLPSELNALLAHIFVTALAFAEDAKEKEVWAPFLADMNILETEGVQMEIDGEPYTLKAVLIAQIGDALAAHEVLGLASPSSGLFCRSCYIKRSEMWQDCLRLGEPRTPDQHIEDVRLARGNPQYQKATGVKGPSLLSGLRFFEPIQCSVFDIFHDLPQGVCKMEVKLALREYVCVKKYFDEHTLTSRLQFFDYGFPDKKNKPSPTITKDYLSNIKSYNLHQTGSQMWCLVRAFPFLFGDLVPADDKFMNLISLLSQIMTIVFAHAVSESDLNNLEILIEEHHRLFVEIFPPQPQEPPAAGVAEAEGDDQPFPEEFFCDVHETNVEDGLVEENSDSDPDDPVTNAPAPSNPNQRRKRKGPRKIRLINKHHHMLHYVAFMRLFGPMILYWCIRYEARHYFFKLAATVCHNFKDLLMTLMEMLQMKIAADRQKPRHELVMGKRGKKFYTVCDTPHSQELSAAGLDELAKVYQVMSVILNGVEYRPELFVTLKLQTSCTHPEFGCIKALYVSENEEEVFVLTQKWHTVRFESKFCAFHVLPPESTSPISVHQASDFPSFRVLAQWKRYDSNKIYLAPRTIA